jgi:hypothetical protein
MGCVVCGDAVVQGQAAIAAVVLLPELHTTCLHKWPDPALIAVLVWRAERELAESGGSLFFGKPTRWHVKPHWRCSNGHVHSHYLLPKDEGCTCLTSGCGQLVFLTFPEDKGGPLWIDRPQ